jgi:hypothetical protein
MAFRAKSRILGAPPARALSPCSVLDDEVNYSDRHHQERQQQPQQQVIVGSSRQNSTIGGKRKLPFEAASASMNLRHRLVCDETVKWLAKDSSSRVEELWLGPVFESSETVLSAISTLPPSVTHLDLDLRNALQLVPQAMPVLFAKRHVRTLSVRVFGDAGAIEVARWMHKNPSMEHLDLRGNRIGSLGARHIVDALFACGDHKLSNLNLSCNCILNGDFIGQLLAFTTNLETLNLAYNWLGDQEVEDICQGLRKNTSLRELNLFGCQRISNEGLKMILECLKYHNTSLQTVQLQSFNDEGKRLIQEIGYWLSLNKAGRYIIKSQDPIAAGLWPYVLEKSNRQPDALFYLIREGSPNIFQKP